MPHDDPNPNDVVAPVPDPPSATTDASASALAPVARRTSSHPYLWLWAMAGGLIAGLASWSGGEATYGHFRPAIVYPPNWRQMSPYERTDYLSSEVRAKTPPAETKNAATTFGLLGAALGVSLGLVGGLARRSPRSGLVALPIGVVAGVAAGGAMAALMVPIFYRLLDPESASLLVPILTLCAMLGALGAAGGLALGVGLGERGAIARASLGGLAGGVVGALVFEVVLAMQFPLMRILDPIAVERTPRLLMHLTGAVLIAVCAALGVQRRGKTLPKLPQLS